MKKQFTAGLILLLCCISTVNVFAQAPVAVTKTNPVKVYMHYMPWFDAPQNPAAGGTYTWGWHWTMNNKNPNVIDGTGKRQIASHYYPLIGPYSSIDPAVTEYHSLLLKLAGIDGVLMDWYGSEGSNGDVGSLLNNSNAMINKTVDAGIGFGLVLEDRFWSNIQNARNSINYAKNNYFNKANYIKSNGNPLMGVFGPVTYQTASQWTDILSYAGQSVDFLPLWYENGDAGSNADGEYAWVYSDYLTGLNNFYANRAPGLGTVMGVAYPGFHDYYAEGGAGSSYFYIPENNGTTLNETLAKYDQYRSNLDFLQLATFNDFGEGTMFEPTLETGYKYLVRMQQYTGVAYTQTELEQVYRLFTLRKKYLNNSAKQSQLDQVFRYFAALQIANAVSLMNSVDGVSSGATVSVSASGSPSESGATGTFTIAGSNITSNISISYTISGTATSGDYSASPALSGTVTLTSATPSITVTVTPVNDGVTEGNETLQLTLNAGTGYSVASSTATLTIADAISAAQSPYGGTARAIPGTIQAEDYDNGGQGIAYNDNDAVNNGGQYRTTERVDVETCSEGGYNTGWTNAGEWIEYTVNVAAAGTYTLQARVASGTGSKNFYIELDGVNISGTLTVPNTGGWQTWQTITAATPALTTGQKIMRITFQSTDMNLNYINFTASSTVSAPVISSASAANGTAGSAFSYTITATNTPTGYNASGLPAGLSTNTATGVISGMPTASGTFNTSVNATNSGGTGTKAVTITIAAAAPVISSAATVSGSVGSAFSYTITATNSPVSYGASGLPAGLTINTSTGIISGTPAASGTYNSTITATNAGGTGSKSIVITVLSVAGDVVGKITVGYQGWFAATGDGSPISAWWHYSQNWSQAPSSSNSSIVSWPDVRDYTSTYQTGWANLNNGQPAKLFSSFNDQSVNTHFLWMQQNNLDVAALQRFNPNGQEGPTRDAITAKVKTAAEAYGRKFYIMYDVSGWTNMQTEVKADWTNKMSAYTVSSAYAKQNGKPVVCIWGFGFNDANHAWTAAVCLDVINWFKSQGCYVIGGVPTYWRTEVNDSRPAFLNTYKAFNMVSPWMVGRIGVIADVDNFYTNVQTPDQSYCTANGIDYQPCVLPGDLQQRQRVHGDFMWRQFYNMKRVGCQGIYISMFDEYNEGNQIAETAENASFIPAGSSFLTLDEDGTAVSSDYYLRLSGDGGKMFKGQIALTAARPTSYFVATATQSPYGGGARNIPGTIQAEDYDTGGQGIAYNDNDAANSGAQYRPSEGVDIETCSEGGYNIGWTVANEWMEYTVNVVTAGTYTLQIRVATPNAGKTIHVELDGVNISGTIAIPNTGGWQVWQTVSVNTTALVVGQKVLRLVMDTNDFNINYLNFILNTTSAPIVSSAASAAGTVGAAFSYSITATNSPTSYAASGLPAGLTLNTMTGVISGTPATTGTYNTIVSATNAAGTGTRTVAISISDVAGTITCYKASGTITINGILTENGWNITKPFSKNVTGTTNNTGTFGVLWDNTNLYVGIKVLDANLYSESANSWDDDAVEVYIDANNNKSTVYDGKDNQIIKGYNKSTVYSKFAISGLQHAWFAVSGGYTVELAIPWAELGITAPVAGTSIGFDIGNDDDDNAGTRDGQMLWNGTINNYQSTSGFGKLTLNAAVANGPAARPALTDISSAMGIANGRYLQLIPNPVTEGVLTVNTTGLKGQAAIEIRSTEGKMLKKETRQITDEKLGINVALLKPGAYILLLRNNGNAKSGKFIVR